MSKCEDSRGSGRIGCGAEWTGLRMLHTGCCHQTFASYGVEGKYHHPPKSERCHSPEEMLGLGARQDARGVWHGQSPDSPVWGTRASGKRPSRGATLAADGLPHEPEFHDGNEGDE